MEILCDGCGAVLRKTAGLHHEGEPPMAVDEDGSLIRCPVCGRECRPTGRVAHAAADPQLDDGA